MLFCANEPTESMKQVILNPVICESVHFVKGSVIMEEDMDRVAAGEADACFIVTGHTKDADTVRMFVVVLVECEN